MNFCNYNIDLPSLIIFCNVKRLFKLTYKMNQNNSISPDSLAQALSIAILNHDTPTTKTILQMDPTLAIHPRLLQGDVLDSLSLQSSEELRDLLYDTKWFPSGDSFGEVILIACRANNIDALRWYFPRWWERDALPLSTQLAHYFRMALKTCVEDAHFQCLSILLMRGIHRLPGVLDDTPLLHDAIRLGHNEALVMLLDAGLDPNSTPDGVLLPIEVALAAGRVAEVQLLLRHGARLYVKSTPPTTEINPFSEFREGQSWVRSIAEGFPWVMLLIEQHFIEKYDLLARFVESKAHATATDPDLRTLAHALVKDMSWVMAPERSDEEKRTLNAKRLDILRRVLDAGISPNASDIDGWTPVLHAVLIGDTDSLSVMYSYGMDLSLCTESGTALTLASQRGAANTVAWLLEHGADPQQKDEQGLTPMDYAVENGNVALQALLLKKISNIF